jgi:hypothetical protein
MCAATAMEESYNQSYPMKNTITHVAVAVIASGIFAAGLAFAESKSDSANPAEILKKIETAGTPGPHHKALEPLVGEWNAEVKSWMSPDAPPTVTKGASKAEWAMDGRFVREQFSGEMMGKPFTGLSLTGYDNQKQKYNSLWVDTMSTSIFTAEGTPSDGAKVITFNGKMDCPVTGEKDMSVKQVLRIINKDKHIFEMHDVRKGESSKTMEITYTRK